MTSVERYEKALAVLDDFIREHKMRHTIERERLLKIMSELDEPVFTVNDLNAKREEAHISIATLYNSLDLFVAARILYRLERGQGVPLEQYKWAIGTKNSMRILCTRCGRDAPFNDKSLLRIIKERSYANFVPDHFTIYVYGVCKACRRLMIQQNNERLEALARNKKKQ